MRPLSILLVDDDADLRQELRLLLEGAGYRVAQAGDVKGAIVAFKAAPPDLALLDQALPDGTGFDVLDAFARIDPRVPLVFLTASGTIELAVAAMKRGVRDFLPKPIQPEALLAAVRGVLGEGGPDDEHLPPLDPFAGTSPAIRALAGDAQRVAASGSPVLLAGETGTGKGVLARWLHEHGPRASGPFLDLNCAGLSRELLDSELFGHERGAFTGAVSAKMGLLEAAHGGTLFLDEIGDIDLAVQGKILKVIEEQRFRRVGGLHDLEVDLRLVAATHRDLTERVASGAFRADLFFRISTLPLTVPALRSRPEDLPVLAERLLALMPARAHRVTLSPAAMATLQAHPWPGNIRELRNVLERAVLLCDRPELQPEDLRLPAAPPLAQGASPAPDEGEGVVLPAAGTLRDMERSHILKVLREEDHRVAEAAARLGIPRSTLYQKLKEYGVQLPRSRRRV
jgi:DNA-binding NtrC family response regulator